MKIQPLMEKVLLEMGEPGPFRCATVGGGDTSKSAELWVNGRHFMVKFHECAEIVQSEIRGLQALSRYVRVPGALFSGVVDGVGVLVMQYLDLRPPHSRADWQAFGAALRRLHGDSTCTEGFGCFPDNFIGGNVQRNGTMQSWVQFFVKRRLEPQLAMAVALPAGIHRKVRQVIAGIGTWLPDRPPAVLLHGDLWSGNLGLEDAIPVFYDPACYYGDPEVDLAMMALFGSVPDSFYQAYQGRLPDRAQQDRWRVYDLYHLLNHFNLFGAGYAASVGQACEQLLRDQGSTHS